MHSNISLSLRLCARPVSSPYGAVAVRNFRLLLLACLLFVAVPALARAEWRELGTYRITAYCPCAHCCGKSDGITADGTHAQTSPDRIAAAPKEIPFGTRLNVEGVGDVIVHDRGGAIRGNRLELFFSTHSEALQWGVQGRKVFIWVEQAASAGSPQTKQAR